jgi:hypothetical protein
VSPEFTTPEYTRKNVSWPTNGSVMILKASAENGSSSAGWRSIGIVVLVVAGDRRHVDRRRQVLDHRVQHRLHARFLKALPPASARSRRPRCVGAARLDLVLGQRVAVQVFFGSFGRGFGRGLDHVVVPLLRQRLQLGRNVLVAELHALARRRPR